LFEKYFNILYYIKMLTNLQISNFFDFGQNTDKT